MAELFFRTRLGESAQGLPRVYFACHPEDFLTCFNKICNDILEYCNCAIFYYDAYTHVPADDEYYLNLGQMQLVVMPVSAKLLNSKSRAMDREYIYAREHNIPVLPIMIEKGLESQFNKKCGDLQLLDQNDSDATALSYRTKLEKYLDSVLISNSLAAQVRSAFRAYIFLSYRKKDRKYAQELMRLIHSNPHCMDVAIWYDEFLTPGENFNHAIGSALEKSQIFALAVTPNLVNEPNYVMAIEYPMACRLKKPVVAAEMVATDRAQLAQYYEKIPATVDPRDEAALSIQINGILSALSLEQKALDPQHQYYIGLAYLSGIDMEVDRERALFLITSAANEGLIPATQKLICMYQNAQGVRRDSCKVLAWMEKLTQQALERYEAEKTIENGLFYIQSLSDLVDHLSSEHSYIQAINVCERWILAASEIFSYKQWDVFREQMIAGMQKTGDLYCGINEYDHAVTWYKKVTSLLYEKAKKTGKVAAWDKVAESCVSLGNALLDGVGASAAEEWYYQAFKIRKILAEKTDSLEMWLRLASCCRRIGDEYRYDMPDRALPWYRRGAELLEDLCSRFDKESFWDDLLENQVLAGKMCLSVQNNEGAEEWFDQAASYWEKKLRAMDFARDKKEICDCCISIGDIWNSGPFLERARRWYTEALKVVQHALSDSADAWIYECMFQIAIKMGDASKQENDISNAQYWYCKAISVHELMREEGIPTPDGMEELSDTCFMLAEYCLENGQMAQAREYYIKAAEADEESRWIGLTNAHRDWLALIYKQIGKLYACEGNYREAIKWYKMNFALYEPLLDCEETDWAMGELADSYESLGKCLLEGKEPFMAREWLGKAVSLRSRKVDMSGMSYDKENLLTGMRRLGEACLKCDDLSEAKKWYGRAFEFCRERAAENPEVSELRLLLSTGHMLAGIHRKLGEILEAVNLYNQLLSTSRELSKKGYNEHILPEHLLQEMVALYMDLKNWDEAIIHCSQLVEYWNEKAKRIQSYFHLNELSSAGYQLAQIYRFAQNPVQAEIWYQKSLEWRKELFLFQNWRYQMLEAGKCAEALGDLCGLQRKETAICWYDQAMKHYGKAAQEEPTVHDRENLARMTYKIGRMICNTHMLRSARDMYISLANAFPDVGRYAKIAAEIWDVLKSDFGE